MLISARPLALLVPAVLLVGCSGAADEPPPPDASIDVAAIQQGLVGLWVGDHATPADTATGTCFASALLDDATPDDLVDVGLLDASYDVVREVPKLSEKGAELWVDAQFACVDFVAESTRAQVAATKGEVDQGTYATCLRVALSEKELRDVAVASLMGDLGGDAVAAFSKAQLTCVQEALPPD